jgi:hypothetical protein
VRLAEDLDLWIRIALDYPIAFSTQAQAIYHQDAESWGGLTNLYQEGVPFAETVQSALAQGKVPADQQDELRELLARHQLFAVHHSMLAGDRQAASRLLDSMERTRRFRFQRSWWRVWASLPISCFKTARQAHQAVRKVFDS